MARHRLATRAISWFVMLPVAVAVVTFAVANRERVDVSFWPAPLTLNLPLFSVVLLVLIVGFVLGALVHWLTTGSPRRRARENARRAEAAERELERLRRQMANAGESPGNGASHSVENKAGLPAPVSRAA